MLVKANRHCLRYSKSLLRGLSTAPATEGVDVTTHNDGKGQLNSKMNL